MTDPLQVGICQPVRPKGKNIHFSLYRGGFGFMTDNFSVQPVANTSMGGICQPTRPRGASLPLAAYRGGFGFIADNPIPTLTVEKEVWAVPQAGRPTRPYLEWIRDPLSPEGPVINAATLWFDVPARGRPIPELTFLHEPLAANVATDFIIKGVFTVPRGRPVPPQVYSWTAAPLAASIPVVIAGGTAGQFLPLLGVGQ